MNFIFVKVNVYNFFIYIHFKIYVKHLKIYIFCIYNANFYKDINRKNNNIRC